MLASSPEPVVHVSPFSDAGHVLSVIFGDARSLASPEQLKLLSFLHLRLGWLQVVGIHELEVHVLRGRGPGLEQ